MLCFLHCHSARTGSCCTNEINRSHQLQHRYTSWRHSSAWLRVRNNWLIFIYLCNTERRGVDHVRWPSISSAATTYFPPFVSLDNYFNSWRTFCPLTQGFLFVCTGIIYWKSRTSWNTAWRTDFVNTATGGVPSTTASLDDLDSLKKMVGRGQN